MQILLWKYVFLAQQLHLNLTNLNSVELVSFQSKSVQLNRRYLSISETEMGNNFNRLSNCAGNESMSVFSGICARKCQAAPESIHILSWSYSLSTLKRQKEVSREHTLGSRFAFIWFERQNWRTELWTGLGLGTGEWGPQKICQTICTCSVASLQSAPR